MNIVYCVTANYIEKIKPSIKSLRYFNPKVKVYLVTEADSCDIEDVEVIDIRQQKWFPQSSMNYHNQFTYIGLLKVCYAELLPCDKVIHLDADTIVNGSLKGFWETDVKGKWFAMAREYRGWYRPFGDKYYNAGVMLLNLKQMREDNIQQTLVDYLNTVSQPWCEQDAFNKYGIEEDKIVDLDVKWNENVMTGFTDDPKVIHYCSISDWWTNHYMARHEYLDRWR